MKTVDQILTANHIEHESDKCLVRVIGQALAKPNAAKSVLLDASGLSLKADLQLASAMIETVKSRPDPAATVATPPASDAAAIQRAPRNLALAISLVISLLALSGTVVAYLNVAKESKGRGAKIVELEQSSQTQQEISRKEYVALSEKTTAALSAAGVSVSEFKIVTGDDFELRDRYPGSGERGGGFFRKRHILLPADFLLSLAGLLKLDDLSPPTLGFLGDVEVSDDSAAERQQRND